MIVLEYDITKVSDYDEYIKDYQSYVIPKLHRLADVRLQSAVNGLEGDRDFDIFISSEEIRDEKKAELKGFNLTFVFYRSMEDGVCMIRYIGFC